MPSFICKVMTPQGQVIKIKLKEEDKITCLKKLKRNGMTPIDVKPSLAIPKDVSRKISSTIASKKIESKVVNLSKEVVKSIKLEDIKKFTKDFLFLLESDFSTVYALKTIISNTKNQNLKNILIEILKNSEKNIFIYKTMESYKQIFPLIYINLIKNWELTGSLNKGLKNAIAYLDNEEKIQYILQEKIFPSILIIFTIALVMFLSIVLGIPLMQEMLMTINIKLELPFVTRVVLFVCNFIVYKWYLVLLVLGIVSLGTILKFRSSEEKLKLDKLKYKNNICGKALYLLDFSRITRCILVNRENKMRLQDSLEICKDVVKNTYMISILEKSINNVFKGNSWIDLFEEDKILDPIIVELIKKGDKSQKSELILKTIEYLEYQIKKEFEKVAIRITEISYIIVRYIILALYYYCVITLYINIFK